MDFINAQRFLEAEYQEYLKDPEGYHDNSGSKESQGHRTDPDAGLPF